jgi:hypothetical protein
LDPIAFCWWCCSHSRFLWRSMWPFSIIVPIVVYCWIPFIGLKIYCLMCSVLLKYKNYSSVVWDSSFWLGPVPKSMTRGKWSFVKNGGMTPSLMCCYR